MRKFPKWLLLLFLVILLVACVPFNEFDPYDSVVATPSSTQSQSPGITPPQDNLVRGPVFLGEIRLMVMESFPVQVSLHIQGEFPTPCHSFSFTIAEPNEKNEIHLEVYSLVGEGETCIQVTQPFEEMVSLPMIGQPDGDYTVWVNGNLIDKFPYPG